MTWGFETDADFQKELGGSGYGQLKLALMNEILGKAAFAPTEELFPAYHLPRRREAALQRYGHLLEREVGNL